MSSTVGYFGRHIWVNMLQIVIASCLLVYVNRQNIATCTGIDLEVPTWYFERNEVRVRTVIRWNSKTLEDRKFLFFVNHENSLGTRGHSGLELEDMEQLPAK